MDCRETISGALAFGNAGAVTARGSAALQTAEESCTLTGRRLAQGVLIRAVESEKYEGRYHPMITRKNVYASLHRRWSPTVVTGVAGLGRW
jgi:hypothetical protein